MKAYNNNMETGYINEGEFSILPRENFLFLTLIKQNLRSR